MLLAAVGCADPELEQAMGVVNEWDDLLEAKFGTEASTDATGVSSLPCEQQTFSSDSITNEYLRLRYCAGVDIGSVLWRARVSGTATLGAGWIEEHEDGAVFQADGWPAVGVYGALYDEYAATGDVHEWGWPLVREQEYSNLLNADRRGRYLLTENGTITWHPERGIQVVEEGPMNDLLFHSGSSWYARPQAGMPTASQFTLTHPHTGATEAWVQRYENQVLVSEPTYTAVPNFLFHDMYSAWSARYGFASNNTSWDVGMPVGNPAWTTVRGSWGSDYGVSPHVASFSFDRQNFERGLLFRTSSGQVGAVSQFFMRFYRPLEGCLGAPTSDPLWWPGGILLNGFDARDAYIQYFQGGTLAITADGQYFRVQNTLGTTFTRCVVPK